MHQSEMNKQENSEKGFQVFCTLMRVRRPELQPQRFLHISLAYIACCALEFARLRGRFEGQIVSPLPHQQY